MSGTKQLPVVSRRAVLGLAASASIAAILAACGGGSATDTPQPAAATAAGTAPNAAAPSLATSPRVAGSSKGELKIALGFDFPAKIDALKDTHLAPYGMLETLMLPDAAEYTPTVARAERHEREPAHLARRLPPECQVLGRRARHRR